MYLTCCSIYPALPVLIFSQAERAISKEFSVIRYWNVFPPSLPSLRTGLPGKPSVLLCQHAPVRALPSVQGLRHFVQMWNYWVCPFPVPQRLPWVRLSPQTPFHCLRAHQPDRVRGHVSLPLAVLCQPSTERRLLISVNIDLFLSFVIFVLLEIDPMKL